MSVLKNIINKTKNIIKDIITNIHNKIFKNKYILRVIRILLTIAFVVFLVLFINEVFIQPYKLKKSIEKAKELYHYSEHKPTVEPSKSVPDTEAGEDNTLAAETDTDSNNTDNSTDNDAKWSENVTPAPTPDPNRDEKGRLKKFVKLLEANEDVKGWIRIDNINGENDTKIDYVVVQSDPSDPYYYLSRDWATHEYLKAGSIFIDAASSVEENSKNLVIHGHNMTSSDDMFHYLLKYHEINFLVEHPIISFDTIYEEALWKVFSIYITPGNNDRGDFFPFTKTEFESDQDFMEFIYQTRLRSLFDMDDVDINEADRILTLSTCSYELPNYRTIIVARKVREGEDPTVNTDYFRKKKRDERLYPQSFYNHYGGEAPDFPSFEEALENGFVPWYKPINTTGQ
ncbi:MAG TPA: class B sortase [Clostridiales bacterium]|jgi:sortase B|nr:class B sortase [Clostridiales bacterium]